MGMITRQVNIPVDADGFVRRECPHCMREFKWLPAQPQHEVSQALYYCPYCGQTAPSDHWWTKAQLEYIKAFLAAEVAAPELDRIVRDLNQPGSFISLGYRAPQSPAPLVEPNDMRKVVPPCHPHEPLKVVEEWEGALHCLICGERFTA